MIFTIRKFWIWFGIAIVQSIIVFFICFFAITQNPLNEDGINSDYWSFSIIQFSCIIVVFPIQLLFHLFLIKIVNIRIMCLTKFWTKLFFVSVFFLSIGVYFAFIFIEDTQNWVKVYKTAGVTFTSPVAYATMILICMLFFLLDYAFLTH